MRESHQRNPLKFCSDGICNDPMQKLTLMTIRKFEFSRVSIPPNPPTFLYPNLIAKTVNLRDRRDYFFYWQGLFFSI